MLPDSQPLAVGCTATNLRANRAHSAQDCMYIDIVKSLLRVEARERPSVYRLLGRADVAQFRRELAANPIRTCLLSLSLVCQSIVRSC